MHTGWVKTYDSYLAGLVDDALLEAQVVTLDEPGVEPQLKHLLVLLVRVLVAETTAAETRWAWRWRLDGGGTFITYIMKYM